MKQNTVLNEMRRRVERQLGRRITIKELNEHMAKRREEGLKALHEAEVKAETKQEKAHGIQLNESRPQDL